MQLCAKSSAWSDWAQSSESSLFLTGQQCFQQPGGHSGDFLFSENQGAEDLNSIPLAGQEAHGGFFRIAVSFSVELDKLFLRGSKGFCPGFFL